ncbi:MAG: germination protein YpeB [Eubacterium sp.]|nr:germination protein YpeB [Eubacterium sp.]
MKRRNVIRLTTLTLCLIAALASFTIIKTNNMNDYKNSLEVSYRQSLSELNDYLETVNTDLNKGLYSNSPAQLREISRDLLAQCTAAKNAVSRLPVSQLELGNAYKFLSQASDYAGYLGEKAQKGETVSEREHNNLKMLSGYASKLSEAVNDMVRTAESGAKITEGTVKNAAKVNTSALSKSFSESAKSFESFPTLLYDGPFSDSVLNKDSELLKNAEKKDKKECLSAAARALGKDGKRFSYAGDSDGRLPSYYFNSGRYSVLVTKRGGYIKQIIYSGMISESNISEKNACELAGEYLAKIGYTDMKQSYYSVHENICTANFAYAKKGVYAYSDLIKVSVSMADGKILALDASTYLTNHRKRAPFRAKISRENAKKRLSPYLTVNGVKPCVIPKKNGKEAQCWEFFCTSRDTGEDALIYINAKSGDEEDIMLLLYSDNGTLVK